MNYALTCSQITPLGSLEDFFPSLAHQDLCRFYIKSITCHHIFVLFTTFLDDEKFCRNGVDPDTKRAKTAKIVSAGRKWVRLEI